MPVDHVTGEQIRRSNSGRILNENQAEMDRLQRDNGQYLGEIQTLTHNLMTQQQAAADKEKELKKKLAMAQRKSATLATIAILLTLLAPVGLAVGLVVGASYGYNVNAFIDNLMAAFSSNSEL